MRAGRGGGGGVPRSPAQRKAAKENQRIGSGFKNRRCAGGRSPGMTSEAGYFWDEYEEDDQDPLSEYTYGVDLGGLREEGGDRVGVVWQEE